MCGLAGVHFDDRHVSPDRDLMERMVEALAHRGPDGRGFHLAPGIGLGHSRLSVVDLHGGSQPMYNGNRSVTVVFNGEIFNYLELRQCLIDRGHRLATSSDTEVLVHLYEDFGDRFVEHLNGQFAIALWDEGRRRLILVRDRAGILPLYWCRIGAPSSGSPCVMFASEIKALLASGLVKPEPDPDGLDELWTYWAPVAPRTPFRDIEQLRPGEMLVIEGSRITRKRYWRWEFPLDGQHRRDGGHALAEELGALLGEASAIRMRADVEVGAYLSGGLDSSSLVAKIQRGSMGSLHTFSIGFQDVRLDESAHQNEVARHLGTRHHHVACNSEDIAATFPQVVWHAEMPMLRSAPAPMRLLSGSVRDAGIKVVLTGEGADEVLGGYDIFKEAKVRQFWARSPGSSWRSALLARLYPYLELAGRQGDAFLREFFGAGIANPGDPLFSHRPRWSTTAQCKLLWSREFSDRVSAGAEERLRSSLPDDFSRWHPFNRAEYLEASILLPGYILSSQGDRMLMANSVEGRFPYLDHRLIAFANALHPARKMPVLREKALLKHTMRGSLPDSILHRPKQPYRAPDASAFIDGNVPDYVRELTSPESLASYGYFDPKKVGLLIAKLRRSRTPAARDNMAFMGVLSTQLWHQKFMLGTN